MSHTPNYDSAVKKILDGLVPGERICALTGEKWFMDETEIGWYKKFNVPPSKYSPLTRRRLINANFVLFDIWYNYHAETGVPIISVIHPASGIRVLPDKEWFTRDFISAAYQYDISRSFFDQFYELTRQVPMAASFNYLEPENSISFISLGDQDSYLVIACKSKRTFYSSNAFDVEDGAELISVNNAQNVYNVVRSQNIYNSLFIRESTECSNCCFLFDCRDCEFCFGATNKRHAKYVWFNEQLDQKTWENKRAEVNLSDSQTRERYEKKFAELMTQAVWPENFNINADSCTGEYIKEATEIIDGYIVCPGSYHCEKVNHIHPTPCHDIYLGAGAVGSSDCYCGLGFGHSQNAKYSLCVINNCIDVEYCNGCYDCEHCFACVGLRRKKFCIFNNQYSEQEYWQKLDELKTTVLARGEYGEFPLMNFSGQYWKNSATVQMYGADENICRALGADFFEAAASGAEGPDSQVVLSELAEIDSNGQNSLADKVFLDPVAKRRFRFLKPELQLYQQLNIAPPKQHPTARLAKLYNESNFPLAEDKSCYVCGIGLKVGKNINYPTRNIYCHDCYLKYLEENN